MIRIVQYNILSTDLATKFYFVNTDTKFLKPEFRWILLKEKLQEEIQNLSIFCLQEVCFYWMEKLIPFFQEVGYYCHYNNYGWKDTGHMGVFIAYPNKYKLEAIKIINIGDSIEDRTTIIDSPIIKDDSLTIKEDVWTQAIRKKNTMLCLKLNYNNDIFCIGTYHMPCFGDSVKLLHIISCIQLLNKFSGNYKHILAGDFNIMPNSSLYKVITESGKYNNIIEKSIYYDTKMFNLKVSTPLKSAYALFDTDPLFTNYAHTVNSDVFNGCLDYIFVSRGWKVNSIKKLPDMLPNLTYPSNEEPSDHLMLAVELELIKKVKL